MWQGREQTNFYGNERIFTGMQRELMRAQRNMMRTQRNLERTDVAGNERGYPGRKPVTYEKCLTQWMNKCAFNESLNQY
jgi:hypothetical protein